MITIRPVSDLRNKFTEIEDCVKSGKLFGNISEGGSGSIDIDFEFDAEWAGEYNYEF